jgi:hypothetical protein
MSLIPETSARLSQELNNLYASFESANNAVVPSSVRTFIESLIRESVIYRSAEWSNLGQDPNDPVVINQTIERVVAPLLHRSGLESHGAVNHVTLIAVVEQIHYNWCGVFPFCRR